MSQKQQTSVRLSDDCRKTIRQMAKNWGLKDAGVIEFAVQVLKAAKVSPSAAVAQCVGGGNGKKSGGGDEADRA